MTQNKTRDEQALEYRMDKYFPDFDVCHDMGFTKKYEIWEVGGEIEKAFCDGFTAAEKQYLGEIAKLKEKIQKMKDVIVDEDLACADCVEAKAEGYTICGECFVE